MPMYSYVCQRCGCDLERVVKFDERDSQYCEEPCEGNLKRAGVEKVRLGKSAYQMQAVLSNGDHIKGQFGKAAKVRKR